MPKVTLTYFNARGAAEGIRFMLAAAGVEYEDKRVEQADWPAIKEDQPFGQLPVLTVDDRQIPQIRAIYRYIARTYGLYGANDVEATEIDIAQEVCEEFTYPMIKYYLEQDPDRKEACKKEIGEAAPKILAKYEKHLKKNNGGEGWVVGNKISYADIVFMSLCETLISQSYDCLLDDFPLLQQYNGRIRAQKGIADWIVKRPKTDH